MNHGVKNVQDLYNAAKSLYDDGVMNGDCSADGILNNLFKGIENLKQNWKGVDAGLRIQEVITVYNSMINVRNNLCQLASLSSLIAVNYRRIQTTNGARMGELREIKPDTKTTLEEYSDTADTIYIVPEAIGGKNLIDTAAGALDPFESFVRQMYDQIMDNWTAGAGRIAAMTTFEDYMSDVKRYKEKLLSVSANVSSALGNYDF